VQKISDTGSIGSLSPLKERAIGQQFQGWANMTFSQTVHCLQRDEIATLGNFFL